MKDDRLRDWFKKNTFDGSFLDDERTELIGTQIAQERWKEFQALLHQERSRARIKIADKLIDREIKLYKIYGDDEKLCVGIKIMADEVRELYEGGTLSATLNQKEQDGGRAE